MLITPYPYKREMINDAVVSVSNIFEDAFGIKDTFIYKDNHTVTSKEDYERKSSFIEVRYTTTNDTLEQRRTMVPNQPTNIIYDKQFRVDTTTSTLDCNINFKVKFKSEIKSHQTRDFIKSTHNTGGRFIYNQLGLFRMDGQLNKILDWITKQASKCMGMKVDIPLYLKHQSKNLTLIGTEAGAESSVDYGMKIKSSNDCFIKDISAIEYDNDTGYWEYTFVGNTKIYIVDTVQLSYDDVIYNEFIPDFMVPNRIRKGSDKDTFFKLVDEDTQNILPTVSNFNLIFSVLLLKEFNQLGDFNPIMLNLRELGEYKINEDYLIKIRDAVNNKEPWCNLTVKTTDGFDKFELEIDNDFNVIFHRVPNCGESLRICLYISSGFIDKPPKGTVMCYKDNCICVGEYSRRDNTMVKYIQRSTIVTHHKE